MVFVSILLSFVVYYDAKNTNVLPWMVILVDIMLFLVGLLFVKFGKK
jgi:hypothetical protein